MRMNYLDIRQELIDNWEQFASNQYPEDLLREFADSAVPIYYGEIIEDWQEMPSEFTDSWQDLGTDGSAGITTLMQIDLLNYYEDRYQLIYNVIAEKMEATNA